VRGIQSRSQISQALFRVEIQSGGAAVTAETYEERIGDMKDCRSEAGGVISEYAVSVSTTLGGIVSDKSSSVDMARGSE
jgi:hypothetical protein